MNSHKSPDVIVIGGGIVGAFASYYLVKEGLEVLLVDKGSIASGTSCAGEGGIAITNKTVGKDMELATESLRLYSQLSEEIGDEMEFRKTGGMSLAETEKDAEILKARLKLHSSLGIKTRWMDQKETIEVEPCLSPHIVGSSICEIEGQINPMGTIFSILQRSKKMGLKVSPFSRVSAIKCNKERVVSVEIGDKTVFTSMVVNAAGPWAPEIGEMVGIKIPISPRRGILLVTEPLPPTVRHFINELSYLSMKLSPEEMARSPDDRFQKGVGFVLEQTKHGNLILGSSRQFVGYRKNVDITVIQHIVRRAIHFAPMFKQVKIIRTYAGLRPYTPDNLPIIGAVPGLEGFMIAAGHEGSGMTLGPITGKLISECIVGKTPTIPIDKFNISRFGLE